MDIRSLISFGFSASIFLSVLAMGMRVAPADLDYVLSAPSRLARALLAMNVVAPAIAILVCKSFSLHPAVIIALITLAIAPVSALFTKAVSPLMAPGHFAYAHGIVFASTVLSVLLTPLGVEAIHMLFGGEVHVRPLAVAEVAIGSILLPLAMGLATAHWWPLTKLWIPKMEKLSALLLLACAIPVVVRAWPLMASLVWEGTFAAIVLFTFAALAAGHFLGGPDEDDRTVLAFATVSRHPGIALVVANLTEQPLAPVGVLLAILMSQLAVIPYKVWRKRLHAAVGAAGGGPPPTTAH